MRLLSGNNLKARAIFLPTFLHTAVPNALARFDRRMCSSRRSIGQSRMANAKGGDKMKNFPPDATPQKSGLLQRIWEGESYGLVLALLISGSLLTRETPYPCSFSDGW